MPSDGKLAVIGGSGLYSMEGLHARERQVEDTPYGLTSGPVTHGYLDGEPVLFLARHGEDHSVAPHRINYRANLWALGQAGADRILAVSTVGGIGPGCVPGALVVPDQLVDYTWGREQTFADPGDPVVHTDFTFPYSPDWRLTVISVLERLGLEIVAGGTYAATQGPRFETAAEIDRLGRDGCVIVGMTGMPEAVLARELDLDYAAICPVGNLAAGISADELSMGEVVDSVAPVLARVPAIIRGHPGTSVKSLLVLIVVLAVLPVAGAAAGEGDAYRIAPDIPYVSDSPDPAQNRLDVYMPERPRSVPAPVIFWIHGGGWYQGNKESAVLGKAETFTRAGYVFVSVNYRLSPRVGDPGSLIPGRVMFPDHPRDVAAAVGWVERHIAGYGGDPSRIVLIGHSAGGQIASLIATDPRFLRDAGVDPDRILGVISLDSVGFDVAALTDPASTARTEDAKPAYWNAFGTPKENEGLDRWSRASPLRFAGPHDPPFLMVVDRDVALRMREARQMARHLGQRLSHAIWPVGLSHQEINRDFGTSEEDGGETARAVAFAYSVIDPSVTRPVLGTRSTRILIRGRQPFRRVSLTAGSRPVGARLRCRFDHGPAHDCSGRNRYRVGAGRHLLWARAYDFSGRLGPPARLRFRVVRRLVRH